MDDLGGFIFSIVLGVLIVIALIWLFVYVVIPIAIFCLLGRQFYRQVNRYKLTKKSGGSLVIVGLAAILVSAIIVSSLELHSLLIPVFSGLFFLIGAISTLAVWGYSKRQHFLFEIEQLDASKTSLEKELQRNSQECESLTNHNRRIQTQCQGAVEEKEKMEEYIRELCIHDPQTLTVKKREWEEFIDPMTAMEMEKTRDRLISELNNGQQLPHFERINILLKIAVIRLKENNRILAEPMKVYCLNLQRIQTLQAGKDSLLGRIRMVSGQLDGQKRAYQTFNASRIVLD